MTDKELASRTHKDYVAESLHIQPPQAFYGLALALIFVLPSQISYALDPKHGPFIAVADILAVLISGSFLLWLWARRLLRNALKPPFVFWAWLCVAILSGLGAENLKAAAQEIIQLALYFGVAYVLFANVLQTQEQQGQAVRVLLAATTLAVGYALVQYWTSTDVQAVKSLFQSRTAYSGFLTLILPLFWGLALFSEDLWERIWAGLVVLLGGLTMLAPPLIWILALILITQSWLADSRRLAIGATFGIAIFLLVTATALPLNRQAFREMLNPFEEGPIYKIVAEEGVEQAGPIVKKRWIEWLPSLNMLAENFVLGVGTGNYQLNIGQPQYYGFLPNVKKSEPDTNNLYLVVASSMGLAGLVCLLAYLGHFARQAGQLWLLAQTPRERALACGLYGACVSLLGANLFTSTFVRGTALAWALIYGMIRQETLAGQK